MCPGKHKGKTSHFSKPSCIGHATFWYQFFFFVTNLTTLRTKSNKTEWLPARLLNIKASRWQGHLCLRGSDFARVLEWAGSQWCLQATRNPSIHLSSPSIHPGGGGQCSFPAFYFLQHFQLVIRTKLKMKGRLLLWPGMHLAYFAPHCFRPASCFRWTQCFKFLTLKCSFERNSFVRNFAFYKSKQTNSKENICVSRAIFFPGFYAQQQWCCPMQTLKKRDVKLLDSECIKFKKMSTDNSNILKTI